MAEEARQQNMEHILLMDVHTEHLRNFFGDTFGRRGKNRGEKSHNGIWWKLFFFHPALSVGKFRETKTGGAEGKKVSDRNVFRIVLNYAINLSLFHKTLSAGKIKWKNHSAGRNGNLCSEKWFSVVHFPSIAPSSFSISSPLPPNVISPASTPWNVHAVIWDLFHLSMFHVCAVP